MTPESSGVIRIETAFLVDFGFVAGAMHLIDVSMVAVDWIAA